MTATDTLPDTRYPPPALPLAWPPPTLPTDRSNAMPQQNTHPQDHNLANQAINDIVATITSVGTALGGLPNETWLNRRVAQSAIAQDQWGNAANVDIAGAYGGVYLLAGTPIVNAGGGVPTGVDWRLLATAGGVETEVGPVLSSGVVITSNTTFNIPPMIDVYTLPSTVGTTFAIQVRPRGAAINVEVGSHINVVRLQAFANPRDLTEALARQTTTP